MSIRLTSKKAKLIETCFLIFLISIIVISCFKPIQAGPGQIGIKAVPLDIGDRRFYINDEKPFSENGFPAFKGGPLYPQVLKSISFISIKIFNQSTKSPLWNTLTIISSSILSFLSLRFAYGAGKLLCDESTGIYSMTIMALCPYTYFYALSGGITIYTLAGTTFITYLILKINKTKANLKEEKTKNLHKILLSITLIYMSFLRPSSIIFCLVVSTIMIFNECKKLIIKKLNKKTTFYILLLFVIPLFIGISELWQTRSYSITALNAFGIEQGTFMGYERDLMRYKITNLFDSPYLINKIEALIYKFLWKINDFFTGIIDIRDTHSPSITPLLSFLVRVSLGTFFFAPITYISLLGIFIFMDSFTSRYYFNIT